MSQSVVQKPSLKPQTASNAGVDEALGGFWPLPLCPTDAGVVSRHACWNIVYIVGGNTPAYGDQHFLIPTVLAGVHLYV